MLYFDFKILKRVALSHERTEVFLLFILFAVHTRRLYMGPRLQRDYFW